MKVLLLGATGATGRLVAQQLLERNIRVSVIVRAIERLDASFTRDKRVTVICADVFDLSVQQLTHHLVDCEAVISCLGHNLSWQGVFGQPRNLVSGVLERVCLAIQTNPHSSPVKVILMSSSGVQNKQKEQRTSWHYAIVNTILRVAIPPHRDNETAAWYLQNLSQSAKLAIEWVAVRPDTLTQHPTPTEYQLHRSVQFDPIFDAQQTSRGNVAHFMAELLTNASLWQHWKSHMPVIYNK
ncbi:NAD(P)-binding oxidoreductase [Motilimonas eburnea]|uniref:NAD(P)-binding oxidoreductase n=1 Tax=Motilimonas eburnea TaxID=1737488 RepID=UPI001E520209|nr:NAD(P)-binding oxidoreductase [Motilimonas eburnea]MCE2573437.1 SDR family oxidoreductase [Motilimonas eburnea]